MRSAFNEKLCSRTSTARLSSGSLTNKPSSLANMHTFFLFLLKIFTLVENATPHPAHFTQKYSPLLPRKKYLPSRGLPCCLPILPRSTLWTPSSTTLSSSDFLDGNLRYLKFSKAYCSCHPLSSSQLQSTLLSFPPLYTTRFVQEAPGAPCRKRKRSNIPTYGTLHVSW